MPDLNSATPDAQLDALVIGAWRLPDQERHEVEAMASTRRQNGHLKWLSPVQEQRLWDLWRVHVRRERA